MSKSKNRLSRRAFNAGVLGGLVSAPWITSAQAQRVRDIERGRRKPNILMIMMDQERSWQDLPKDLDLPIRHGFANEGVSFSQYHVSTMPCAPSRAVIWTGQHPQKTGVIANPGHAGSRELNPSRTPILPQMLRDQGYYTAIKGKWHLSDLRAFKGNNYMHALQHVGYDEWQHDPDTFGASNEAAARDQLIARDAIEFLHRRPDEIADKPWFLTLNFIHPHDVMWYDASGHQQDQRANPNFVSTMEGAPNRPPFNKNLGFDLPDSFYLDKSQWPYAQSAFKQINDIFYGALPDDVEAYRDLQNFYFNCLRDSESNLQSVLKTLDATGQSRETVVILTSDHGELAGAHRQRNKGPFMFKENLRVPFVVRDPITESVGQSSLTCSAMDMTPTLLGFAGIGADQMQEQFGFLKGDDLSSVVAEPSSADGEERSILIQFNALNHTNPRIFTERVLADLEARQMGKKVKDRTWPVDDVQFETRGFGRGVFDGRYKFARWFSPGDHHKPMRWSTLVARNDLELIDTHEDPNELVNLAANLSEHRDLILAMNKKLNDITEAEVGVDDGSYLPGDPGFWRG